MRQKLNALLNDNARYGHFSVAIILISLVPLMFKDEDSTLLIVDYATTAVFIFDYVARWAVADLNLGRGHLSFLIYPFTPMAIIDLLTILPTFFALNQGFKALRMIRMVRILKFGAFVELAPGKDGMVHISKLADHRIGRVEDAVNVGDMIWVKVTDIDEKGRVNLSHIDAIREIKAKKLAKQN